MKKQTNKKQQNKTGQREDTIIIVIAIVIVNYTAYDFSPFHIWNCNRPLIS